MNSEYWLERWQENRIGFHKPGVNPLLTQFWTRVVGSEPARVLVPLCGKSADLVWLRDQGHDVSGVELSEVAARAFFTEQKLEPTITIAAPFRVYRVPRITYYVGDFFALDARTAGRFDAVYDRAALIAMPDERRPAYVAHLASLLAPHGHTMLITLEYDQARMAGPPFSVSPAEVRTLFEPLGAVEELYVHDCLQEEPRFRERGLDWLTERVFLISHSRA